MLSLRNRDLSEGFRLDPKLMVVPAHQKPERRRRALYAGRILEFGTVGSVVCTPRRTWSVRGQNDDDLAMSVANGGCRAGNTAGRRASAGSAIVEPGRRNAQCLSHVDGKERIRTLAQRSGHGEAVDDTL